MGLLKITVVFLGRASELSQKSIITVELPENATLYDLLKKLGETVNPRIFTKFLEGQFVFVTYVNDTPTISLTTPLRDGDRVTLITPEMGG
ncbi:MAG: MoaD/ThiS family protein [Thermosphaera aggregans]|uniref:MoaD/ThiS family protein n=1 Tax=Thermosphaera aggregans TaxID=54254 RepID=UPI003C0D920C